MRVVQNTKIDGVKQSLVSNKGGKEISISVPAINEKKKTS